MLDKLKSRREQILVELENKQKHFSALNQEITRIQILILQDQGRLAELDELIQEENKTDNRKFNDIANEKLNE